MVKCSLCSRKAVVHFKFSKPLCAEHFKKQIESRVKKEFRRTNIINLHKEKKLNTVIIIKKDDYKDKLVESVIEPILKESGIIVKKRKTLPRVIPNKAVLLSEETVESFSNKVMDKIINGRDPCFKKNKTLFPLKNILRTEAYIYSLIVNHKLSKNEFFDEDKINKLDNRLKEQNNLIDEWLSYIEKKHPGTRFSIMRTHDYLCSKNEK